MLALHTKLLLGVKSVLERKLCTTLRQNPWSIDSDSENILVLEDIGGTPAHNTEPHSDLTPMRIFLAQTQVLSHLCTI